MCPLDQGIYFVCEKGENVSVKINLARLKKNIEELAKFGVLETGGICRESFSIADLAAKRWLMEKIRNAGLLAVRDEAGNIWGRLEADEISAAKNIKGFPLTKAMADAGLNHRQIASARRDPNGIRAYLELHIEQGPLL